MKGKTVKDVRFFFYKMCFCYNYSLHFDELKNFCTTTGGAMRRVRTTIVHGKMDAVADTVRERRYIEFTKLVQRTIYRFSKTQRQEFDFTDPSKIKTEYPAHSLLSASVYSSVFSACAFSLLRDGAGRQLVVNPLVSVHGSLL